MTEQLRNKCEKYRTHFSELFKVPCHIVEIPEDSAPTVSADSKYHRFCDTCNYEDAEHDLLATCCYGCNEAHRWNGKYVYYCPMGLAFIAASISSESGDVCGGLVMGPIVMGENQDVVSDLPVEGREEDILQLPAFLPKDIYHISEILCAVTSEISGIEDQKFKNLLYDQEQVLKDIYKAKTNYQDTISQNAESLLSYEKVLRSAVLRGEKNVALDMLNDVLAKVYVYSNYDINSIKARMLEMLVILSRATIEAGADTNEIFRLSESYILEIERTNDVDQLAVWISDIVRRFIIQAFDLAQVKHSDVVYKVTNYIKQNCQEKLTLDTLAKEVYLSKSYLSSIFKAETGISLTEYIANVRIEKSKKLLTTEGIAISKIAQACGFKDQSYFSKVFKKETGISPKRFRKNYFGMDTYGIDIG
ncbi:MAG: AraC family transcriptional regulator [Oscillospiraceae bacterium]|nr:AraC family transcriptional regulator [Oscillospiraceae bacterium]